MKSKTIKGATIILFSVLITCFVAYKSKTSSRDYSQLNDSILYIQEDAIPKNTTNRRNLKTQPLKVTPLGKSHLNLNLQSVRKVNPPYFLNNAFKLASSSKSAILLNSEDMKQLIKSFSKADSLNKP